MIDLYVLMLALCGQPKMKMCYVEALNCYRSGRQMKCTADIVIKQGNKTSRKKVTVPMGQERLRGKKEIGK
jgi:hypothetical protein